MQHLTERSPHEVLIAFLIEAEDALKHGERSIALDLPHFPIDQIKHALAELIDGDIIEASWNPTLGLMIKLKNRRAPVREI